MVGLSVLAYLGSKVVGLGLLCLLQCLVLLVVVGIGCGLAGSWWFALLVILLAAAAGVAIGLALSAAAKTAEAAAAALPLIILPLVILGGSLLPLADLPAAATYLADTMPSRWAFEGLVVNEALSRSALEVPDPDQADGIGLKDMAEQWFSTAGWRARRFTPVVMLAALGGIALYAAYAILTAGEDRRSGGIIAREARIPV
jgi:hypothetical protein